MTNKHSGTKYTRRIPPSIERKKKKRRVSIRRELLPQP